jgi:uncharacterized protein YjdB
LEGFQLQLIQSYTITATSQANLQNACCTLRVVNFPLMLGIASENLLHDQIKMQTAYKQKALEVTRSNLPNRLRTSIYLRTVERGKNIYSPSGDK